MNFRAAHLDDDTDSSKVLDVCMGGNSIIVFDWGVSKELSAIARLGFGALRQLP